MSIARYENQNDAFVWDKTTYRLVDVDTATDGTLFNPHHYGMNVVPICKYCNRGFYCTFHLVNGLLLLTKLNIMTADGVYPEICGVRAMFCSDDHSMEYCRIREVIRFTGTIRIGFAKKEFWYDWRQELGIDNIKRLWDLQFSDGKLISAEDFMPLVEAQKNVEAEMKEFFERNMLAPRSIERLRSHCRLGASAIPYFDVLNPGTTINILQKIKKRSKTPQMFIKNYNHYGLSHRLTLEYLERLGITPDLSTFLKNLVSNTQTEKMIVLEVIETLLQTIAAGHWDERVHPDYLYKNANIPQSLTETIRNRLRGISMSSWNPKSDTGRWATT